MSKARIIDQYYRWVITIIGLLLCDIAGFAQYDSASFRWQKLETHAVIWSNSLEGKKL